MFGFNFNIDLKEVLNSIGSKWPRKSSLFIALLIVLFSLLSMFSGINIVEITFDELIIIFILLMLVFFFWLKSAKINRAPKGKIGFAVAIRTKIKKQREKIASDFVETLRELLFQGNLRYQFSLIELSQYHSAKIKDAEDAENYLHTTKCQFLIFGRARIRQIEGKDNHFLNMEGIVAHRPVPEKLSRHLGVEFAELFPRKLKLLSENDLFLFEFTSQWVNFVARYIIGIASLISGNVEYAQELFEDLQKKIDQQQTNLPAIVKIRRRLPRRLNEVYLTQVRFNHAIWRRNRDQDSLNRTKFFLDKLESLSPNDYTGHLLRGIWHFVANRDIPAAKREVRKCRYIKEGTWCYSYAFLCAYEGNMKEAIKYYRLAFKYKCETRVPFEIEEFIDWVLKLEPDKVQLHFCLGFVNYRGKGDKLQALRDFEKFIEITPNGKFIEVQGIAKLYIERISEDLASTNSE